MLPKWYITVKPCRSYSPRSIILVDCKSCQSISLQKGNSERYQFMLANQARSVHLKWTLVDQHQKWRYQWWRLMKMETFFWRFERKKTNWERPDKKCWIWVALRTKWKMYHCAWFLLFPAPPFNALMTGICRIVLFVLRIRRVFATGSKCWWWKESALPQNWVHAIVDIGSLLFTNVG